MDVHLLHVIHNNQYRPIYQPIHLFEINSCTCIQLITICACAPIYKGAQIQHANVWTMENPVILQSAADCIPTTQLGQVLASESV